MAVAANASVRLICFLHLNRQPPCFSVLSSYQLFASSKASSLLKPLRIFQVPIPRLKPEMISRRTLYVFCLATLLLLVPTFLIVHPESPAWRLRNSGEESFSQRYSKFLQGPSGSQGDAAPAALGQVIMVRRTASSPESIRIDGLSLLCFVPAGARTAKDGQRDGQGAAGQRGVASPAYHGAAVPREPSVFTLGALRSTEFRLISSGMQLRKISETRSSRSSCNIVIRYHAGDG